MKPLHDVLQGPFANWLGDDDWTPWFAFMAALRGEPMTRDERKFYRRCTRRQDRPRHPFGEAWVVVGRRGRKSAVAAIIGCYMAVYGKWPRAAGETVRMLIIAVNKDQAKIVRGYCQAILESRPGLARLIDAMDRDSITLTNGIVIQCVPNSYRSIRGPTVIAAIFEEVAFWRSEYSANPDKEILRAVRPSMLTVPGALLLGISSPYARKGLLYEKYKKHFGRDGSKVLVWQADTQTMNPQVDQDVIKEAYADDPIAAAAEYGAEFRSDIEGYIDREALEAVISVGVRERPPITGARYFAFCDPSGGSADSFTIAIAHQEKDMAVLDCVREVKPPFSPADVVAEYAALLKAYRVTKLNGDKYAGVWPVEAFKSHNIKYEQAAQAKSDLYRDFLPIINSGNVDLLDLDRLTNQLASLERRTARSGKDSIDHAPGGHDDVANVVAGVITSLVTKKGGYDLDGFFRNEAGEIDDSDESYRNARRYRYVGSGGMWR